MPVPSGIDISTDLRTNKFVFSTNSANVSTNGGADNSPVWLQISTLEHRVPNAMDSVR
jgi:hypothetical protein